MGAVWPVVAPRGALSADLSYPLPRLLGGGPDLYLFGQSFVGYGENLLDYDRRMTRFRIGVASAAVSTAIPPRFFTSDSIPNSKTIQFGHL